MTTCSRRWRANWSPKGELASLRPPFGKLFKSNTLGYCRPRLRSMKSSERNWSPDHSTKWPQSMALLRSWFLVRGSKRSRLDEGPSSSNRTVNSRCSEIELEHNGTLAAISGGQRSTKEKYPHGTASRGTEEDSATAVFTRVVPDPNRARQVVHTRLVIHLVRYRGSRTGRWRLAPFR